MQDVGGNHLRNSTLAEIVGAWEITGSPHQPRVGSYFAVREDCAVGWLFENRDVGSANKLRALIDAAEPRGNFTSNWVEFEFSEGKLTSRGGGANNGAKYWFRTAQSLGRMPVCEGVIHLKPGDIVWAEFFSDPNKRGDGKDRKLVSSPETCQRTDPAASGSAEKSPEVILPSGYDPFSTIELAPPDCLPDWAIPKFSPPLLISPQPLREYLLRRLPEATDRRVGLLGSTLMRLRNLRRQLTRRPDIG